MTRHGKHASGSKLDITSVTDREEIAAAFGQRAAWQATITRIIQKEAKETDRRKKQHLRLMLLNAQTQLQLYP